MPYTDKNLHEINRRYIEIKSIYKHLSMRLITFSQTIKNDKAKEYMQQGVFRRLMTLSQCLDNVFCIFPPNREKRLSKAELVNVDINLHAFFINISGIFDNLAWVFVHENGLYGSPKEGKIGRNEVGLFNKRTQEYLPKNLMAHLSKEQINRWYKVIQKIIGIH